MNKKISSGFTLIELMIVVAIIGVLAGIAIPAYSDYLKRARVAEMLAKAAEIKTSLTEYYNSKNVFPTVAQSSIQVATPSSNIANVNAQTTNGTVGVGAQATFAVVSNATNIGALTLTFTGTATANGVGWVCTSSGADVRLAPGTCK